jgi:hypothetical protein
MDPPAFRFWLTHCVIPAHWADLGDYLVFSEETKEYNLKDLNRPVPPEHTVLLLVDGDYSHINNEDPGADCAALAARLMKDAPAVSDASVLGCLDYAAQVRECCC